MHSAQTPHRLLNSRTNPVSFSRAQMFSEGAGSVQGDSIHVQYLGRLEIAVSGRCTGTLYRFSPVKPIQAVDPRDAFHLLEGGLFGIAL